MVLRGFVPYMICGNIGMANIWIDTHVNTADDPTRDVPVREPVPPPKWLVEAYGPACF